jgi:hypothetical protein
MGKNKRNQQKVGNDNLVDDHWKDILNFKAQLSKHMGAFIPDLSGLEQAINALKTPHNSCWGYKVDKIIFKDLYLNNSGKTENTTLDLTIKISGSCDAKNPIDDFLNDYCLEFLIRQRSKEQELRNAYRFECHIYSAGDNTPEFNHPSYHLQYGGEKLTGDEEFNTGDVLFCDAPRVMHPPMDIILAIDFVLANYYSFHICEEYRRLIEDEDYQKIIKNAQNRFWKPYFLGLAANFIGSNQYCFQGISNLSVNKTLAQNLLTYRQEH